MLVQALEGARRESQLPKALDGRGPSRVGISTQTTDETPPVILQPQLHYPLSLGRQHWGRRPSQIY